MSHGVATLSLTTLTLFECYFEHGQPDKVTNGTEKSLPLRILLSKVCLIHFGNTQYSDTYTECYFDYGMTDKEANGTERSLPLRILCLKFVSYAAVTPCTMTLKSERC